MTMQDILVKFHNIRLKILYLNAIKTQLIEFVFLFFWVYEQLIGPTNLYLNKTYQKK